MNYKEMMQAFIMNNMYVPNPQSLKNYYLTLCEQFPKDQPLIQQSYLQVKYELVHD